MTIEHVLVNAGIYAALVLLISATLFIIMQLRRDNSLIDIAYGPIFFISAFLSLLLTKNQNVLAGIICALIGIWSLRLSYRIGKKNWNKPEDVRYAAWRAEWMKRGTLYFIIRSFLQINLLQGLIIICIASPFIIAISSDTFSPLAAFIGGMITLLGISLETYADHEVDTFVTKKQSGLTQEPFLRTGIFRYTRRPNYFGETLVWWGLAIMVLPLPLGYLGLLSPLVITYIVTKITGPMLEKIFIERYGAAYEEYMRTTSYFIPLPPKVGTTPVPPSKN